MKKLLGFLGALVIAFSLTSCGFSQKTADKINNAAASKEYLTWTEVVDMLGSNYVSDFTVGDASKVSGVVTWYQGYESYEEVKAALEEGKTVKRISVTFVLGDAKDATYTELKKEEEK